MSTLYGVQKLARVARRGLRSLYTAERFYRATYKCPRVELGNPDASFVVNPSPLGPRSTVYSFGVGTDISFDLECIRKFSLHVHAFDPTPRSREWLATQVLPPEFHLHEYGLAHFDGSLDFYPPEDPTHVSYSTQQRSGNKMSCPVRRLTSIMKELGHNHLDLLKIDIEGSEYGALDAMLADGIKPRQLCVEFHHRWPEIGPERTNRAIDSLQSVGYRLFHVAASGEEFSFILVYD